MKKLATLEKTLATVTNEEIKELVNCDAVNTEYLTENEKLAVLVYSEIKKAIDNKDIELLLDCNYEKSQFHKNDTYLVDYYRLIDRTTRQSIIQMYFKCKKHRDAEKSTEEKTVYSIDSVNFLYCFSVKEVYRPTFAENYDTLNVDMIINKKTNKYKHSQRNNIDYNDTVAVAKLILSVLNNTYKAETETE